MAKTTNAARHVRLVETDWKYRASSETRNPLTGSTLKPVLYRVDGSQRPRVLRRRSAAARLLGLRVRILPCTWMSFSCGCCVLDRSSRVALPSVCVWVWSWSLDNEAVWPTRGCCAMEKNYTVFGTRCTKLYGVIIRGILSKQCYINVCPTINRYVAMSTLMELLSENFRVITFFHTMQTERKFCVK
jgi:hypothetical protein